VGEYHAKYLEKQDGQVSEAAKIGRSICSVLSMIKRTRLGETDIVQGTVIDFKDAAS
jgi:hypothetical protein